MHPLGKRNNSKISALIGMAILLCLGPGRTQAAFVCFEEQHYPSVFHLKAVKNGVAAMLGGQFVSKDSKSTYVMTWHQDKGWVSVKQLHDGGKWGRFRKTNSHGGKCNTSLPLWSTLSPEQRRCGSEENCRRGSIAIIHIGPGKPPPEHIEERPSDCAAVKDSVYFGINFYRGEGTSGYGGLGKYTPGTEKMEIHRPYDLRQVPIHKVVWDGKSLWGATTANYECMGHPPALGLVRYDWQQKQLTKFDGEKAGPCGLVIHDLLWRDGMLWVATELGLSTWQRQGDIWSHYLPDPKVPGGMVKQSCPDIYNQVLAEVPKDKKLFDSNKSFYQNLLRDLARHRPWFKQDGR